MEEIIHAFLSVFTPGEELFQITLLTMEMAFFSTTISMVIGVPLGILLGMSKFRGKSVVMRILNTLMSLPPVLAGLIVFFILSRSGPLGSLRLLYTVNAMVTAQVIIITPIVCGLSASAISAVAARVHETAKGFGMKRAKELLYLLYENRTQLFSFSFLAFGRSIGEVGAVSLVGGNVQFKTRVMTTAIMLETNKGNFEVAIALGVALLIVSFIINSIALSLTERAGRRRKHGARRLRNADSPQASIECPSKAVVTPQKGSVAEKFQLHVQNLTKVYRDRTVLDIDDLTFTSGRIYALVGPNGSGKTTLLKILSKTIPFTEGTVECPERDIGYLPQKSYVFDVSVLHNVEMAITERDLGKKARQQRAWCALEMVGMEKLAYARGSTLSGGEAQRVALARLLVSHRDILYLDEPTSAMDVKGTIAVEKALKYYAREHGTLLVMSTHAPAQAVRISEEAVILYEGRMVEEGPTEQVIEDPMTPEAQEFLAYWRM